MSTERRPLVMTGEVIDPNAAVADALVDAYFDPDAAEMQHIARLSAIRR